MGELDLVQKVACADLLLGTFGVTPQALMTMQNKIHEGLAMRVPVINGDSPVMRDVLSQGETIYLCERENPASLADAIRTLQRDPELRAKIASQGYEFYQNHLSFRHLSVVLVSYLKEILEQEKS
jgi:glycosyltransferase involved in cell wall biosynthesis